jgi:hypothetical protein
MVHIFEIPPLDKAQPMTGNQGRLQGQQVWCPLLPISWNLDPFCQYSLILDWNSLVFSLPYSEYDVQ